MPTHLLQLLADNRKVEGRVVRIEAKKDSREATVYLYDAIVSERWMAEYYGGVCPQDLVPQIDALDVDVIHLRINSPGGDVFAGKAIASALERHKAKVVAHVDGLAASAATAVAVACDEILMAPGAMFMIHNAWTFAIGDRNDLLATAALLEKVDGTLAKAYADCTGKSLADLAKAMDDETWFTAEEAVEYGFADGVEEGEKEEASASARWNLQAFAKAPKAVVAAPAPETEKLTEGQLAVQARAEAAKRRNAASLVRDPIPA